MIDGLRSPKVVLQAASDEDDPPSSQSHSLFHEIASHVRQSYRSLVLYTRHPSVLPSLSLSLLYLTVLSFGGQFVSYLLAADFTPAHIAVLRVGSVALELAATWLAPAAMRKVGPVRAGLWFISWQLVCLALGASMFVRAKHDMFVPAAMFVGGVIASRVGLWGFDLCAQVIIQEVRWGLYDS